MSSLPIHADPIPRFPTTIYSFLLHPASLPCIPALASMCHIHCSNVITVFPDISPLTLPTLPGGVQFGGCVCPPHPSIDAIVVLRAKDYISPFHHTEILLAPTPPVQLLVPRVTARVRQSAMSFLYVELHVPGRRVAHRDTRQHRGAGRSPREGMLLAYSRDMTKCLLPIGSHYMRSTSIYLWIIRAKSQIMTTGVALPCTLRRHDCFHS